MLLGIYAINNLETGKIYVGSSKNIEKRYDEHRYALRRGDHFNYHLQNAWNKYGEKAFQFIVCEYVENLESLVEREQYWLDFHRLCVDVYNTILAVGRPAECWVKNILRKPNVKLVRHIEVNLVECWVRSIPKRLGVKLVGPLGI